MSLDKNALYRNQLLSVDEVSALLCVPESTLNNWRVRGIGPAYIKLGQGEKAKVRYSVVDIDAYVAEHRREPSVRESLEGHHGTRKAG